MFSEFTIFDERGVIHPRGMHELFPFFARTGRTLADVFAQRSDLSLPDGRDVPVYRGMAFDSLFWGNFILPTSMVFSREAAAHIGTFKPELRTQQDYEYWLRFSQRYSLACIDHVLVRYRRHSQQLTDHSRIEHIVLAVHGIIEQYEEHFATQGRAAEYARRKAGVLTELAKVYLGQGRRHEARQRLRASVHLDAQYLPAYGYLMASLIPPAWVHWLRRARHR